MASHTEVARLEGVIASEAFPVASSQNGAVFYSDDAGKTALPRRPMPRNPVDWGSKLQRWKRRRAGSGLKAKSFIRLHRDWRANKLTTFGP